jgi:hypothetical protein
MESMFRHQILIRRRLALLEFDGPVNVEELLRGYRSMTGDSAFSPTYPGVVDLRRARVRVDADETEQLGRYVASDAASTAPWACLVRTPLSTALTEYYGQLVSQQHPTRVFTTVCAAAEYLNVELADLLVETS